MPIELPGDEVECDPALVAGGVDQHSLFKRKFVRLFLLGLFLLLPATVLNSNLFLIRQESRLLFFCLLFLVFALRLRLCRGRPRRLELADPLPPQSLLRKP